LKALARNAGHFGAAGFFVLGARGGSGAALSGRGKRFVGGVEGGFDLAGGFAGTGKSTVLKVALDDLGLAPHSEDVPGVVTATFTGKAALVLRRKGTPARTIHSLIYSVIEATEEEVEAAEKKIDEAVARARGLTAFERTTAEATIEAKTLKVEPAKTSPMSLITSGLRRSGLSEPYFSSASS
jgi:hypothetical protein